MRGYIALFLTMLAAPAWACPLEIRTPLHIVPLYDADKVAGMEAVNRFADICPPAEKPEDVPARSRCIRDLMSPAVDYYDIYDAPDGAVAGGLMLVYGQNGIEGRLVTFGPPHDNIHVYTPTVYDSDWGYGPWYHATLLDARENWMRVALPVIGAGWIEKKDGVRPLPMMESGHHVFAWQGRGVVVENVDTAAGTVLLRDETAADSVCGDGAPEGPPVQATQIPFAAFYDRHCELSIIPKYLRGC